MNRSRTSPARRSSGDSRWRCAAAGSSLARAPNSWLSRRFAGSALATGVGPVALAVADAIRRCRVYGVDISASAIALARKNARRLKLRNVTFLRGDLFAPLPKTLMGTVDVITIHPPYVPTGELRDLPEEITRFEPKESITDFSRTGMRLLERTTAEAPRWLGEDGWLLIEVSPDRYRSVSSLLRQAGFRDIRSTIGPVKFTRVIVGRAPVE